MKKTALILVFFGFCLTKVFAQIKVEPQKLDIMYHQQSAMKVLGVWGGASVLLGGAQAFSKSNFIRGVGIQNIAWGAIDLGIAYFASNEIKKKGQKGFDANEERKLFKRILGINTLLDLLYMGSGFWLMQNKKDSIKGHGTGILLQGGFLFLFDGINLIIAI